MDNMNTKDMQNSLPLDDLKKYGIVGGDNNFSKKLSPAEVGAFLDGGILVAENKANSLTFRLVRDGKLEVNAYLKDMVNHRDVSSAEIFDVLRSGRNLYKAMADHGVVSEIGHKHLNNNPENEKVAYIELINERGKTVFFGNDLLEKAKGFKVGDAVQIKQTGTRETELVSKINGTDENLKKFDNVFSVEALTDKNREFRSKLFEYDRKLKTIVDMDTTKYDLKSVNGTTLSREQLERLRKGKEVKVDEETAIQLSPKAGNESKLRSNAKNLLLVMSLAVDGGLSYLILKGASKLVRMEKERKAQIDAKKYEVELVKLKAFMQGKAEQYPDNKKIVSDINIIGRELANVRIANAAGRKPEKNDDTVRLKVNDYDVYEDAKREREDMKSRETKAQEEHYRSAEAEREEERHRGRTR